MQIWRWMRWVLLVVGLAAGASACHGGPHGPVVNTTADGSDAVPGDGVCEMTPGAGDCSLRAAVDEVNASASMITISLPEGHYVLTGGVDDANGGGDLDVAPASGTLSITGEGAGAVVDGGGVDGVLDVHGGQVTVTRVAATGAAGPGARVRPTGDLRLLYSAVHGNAGPGVEVDAAGAFIVFHSTLSTNGGAGVDTDGTVTVAWTTVTANGAGGLVGSSAPTVGESVVAEQAAGADCSVATVSNGHNLDTDGSCGFGQPSDLPSTAPLLAGLSGDPLPFHRPLPGSPVIDSVPPAQGCGGGLQTHDQRYVARAQGPSCDRGAIEAGLWVDDAGDAPDAAPGDGICDAGDGTCGLRAAIDEANASANLDIVSVDPALGAVSLTVGGANEDGNSSGDLDVLGDLTILGNGVVIDAGGIDRVLDVRSGVVRVERTALTGGSAITGGGARVAPGATLALDRSTVTANQSTGVFECAWLVVQPELASCFSTIGGGAGVWSDGALVVSRSAITGNTALGGASGTRTNCSPFGGCQQVRYERWSLGGGIAITHGAATITDSTIADNTIVQGLGAGVWAAGGQTSLVRTTVAGNVVPLWAWNPGARTLSTMAVTTLYPVAGEISLHGTIVAGAGDQCAGGIVSLGRNLATDATCALGAPGDQPSTDPLLGALGANGGATESMLPAAGSPAVGAIPVDEPGLCDGLSIVDQRDRARVPGPCDIGAVERQADDP